jgi:magnesium chelatase family protein
MAGLGAMPADALQNCVVLGELSLDGTITHMAGVLPASIAAYRQEKGLICSGPLRPEAAWAVGAEIDILLLRATGLPDLADFRGQESARRALEVALARNVQRRRHEQLGFPSITTKHNVPSP